MVSDNPRRRADVTLDQLADGSAVLYDKARKMAHPLTQTATLIWQACDGEHTLAAIVDELAAAYDAPRDAIEGDVTTFLRQLTDLHLLEESESDV